MSNLLLLTSILLSTIAFAGPTVKENGGGLIELRFVSVWQNRNELVKPCAVAGACQTTQSEQAWVQKILKSSSVETNLVFVSAKQNPDKFLNQQDLIGTAPQIGAKIFVNQDTLVKHSEIEGFSFPIRNLVSAWLYHNGLDQKDSLTLAYKIAQFWSQKVSTINLFPYGIKDLEVQFFSSDQTSVFVSDSHFSNSLTSDIIKNLYCSTGFFGNRIQKISKMTWELNEKTSKEVRSLVHGQIQYSCVSKVSQKEEVWMGSFNLWIDFELQNSEANLKLKNSQIQFQNLRQK